MKRHIEDLTGLRFGMLYVINQESKYKQEKGRRVSYNKWLCKCDCGAEISVIKSALLGGRTRSCGCSRWLDITGHRYGRLIAIRSVGYVQEHNLKGHGRAWEFQCDCGKLIVRKLADVRIGWCKSCGCGHHIPKQPRCPDWKKKYSLNRSLRALGLSREDYYEMLDRQGDVCAICGNAPDKRRLSIDHHHASGVVRGLLCSGCNTGLGLFKEDLAILRKAAEYIESFSPIPKSEVGLECSHDFEYLAM